LFGDGGAGRRGQQGRRAGRRARRRGCSAAAWILRSLGVLGATAVSWPRSSHERRELGGRRAGGGRGHRAQGSAWLLSWLSAALRPAGPAMFSPGAAAGLAAPDLDALCAGRGRGPVCGPGQGPRALSSPCLRLSSEGACSQGCCWMPIWVGLSSGFRRWRVAAAGQSGRRSSWLCSSCFLLFRSALSWDAGMAVLEGGSPMVGGRAKGSGAGRLPRPCGRCGGRRAACYVEGDESVLRGFPCPSGPRRWRLWTSSPC
jgi:hypothetical protein